MMDDLEDLFAQAKAAAPDPSAALMARVLADAAQEQALRSAAAVAPGPTRRPRAAGLLAALAGLFGGGGVLAGVGTAALAGLYLGFVQPVALTTLADGWLGGGSVESLDLMPGVDALLAGE